MPLFISTSTVPFFKTMFDTTQIAYEKRYDNCRNTLCYTYNHSIRPVYKPHSGYGRVGVSSAGYLHSRNRI